MKAILKFDLSDYEDQRSHKLAIKALDLASALYDISTVLRSIDKYQEPKTFTSDKFYEILRDHNVDLEEIY